MLNHESNIKINAEPSGPECVRYVVSRIEETTFLAPTYEWVDDIHDAYHFISEDYAVSLCASFDELDSEYTHEVVEIYVPYPNYD